MNADEAEFLSELASLRHRQRTDCEKLIRSYFPPRAHVRAIWIAYQISGMYPGDTSAVGENLWGLFHIDPLAVGLGETEGWLLLNPIRNVAAAVDLWNRFGWSVFGANILKPPPPFDDEEVPF